jgi:hypothetical protein
MHLRVLAREVAIGAVVTARVDGYVLAEGLLRSDGSLQSVLDRRLSWGAALRKNIAMFEELVRAHKPGAGPLDRDTLLTDLRRENTPQREDGAS